MSEKINPEAAQPTTIQSYELSDRNPPVANWGGTDAEGGQIASPSVAEERVTQAGPPVSPDEGLKY